MSMRRWFDGSGNGSVATVYHLRGPRRPPSAPTLTPPDGQPGFCNFGPTFALRHVVAFLEKLSRSGSAPGIPSSLLGFPSRDGSKLAVGRAFCDTSRLNGVT